MQGNSYRGMSQSGALTKPFQWKMKQKLAYIIEEYEISLDE